MQQVAWLRVRLEGERFIFGRLAYSSVKIPLGEPFEVLLDRCYEVADGRLRPTGADNHPNVSFAALYLKIRPEQEVAVFSAERRWKPTQSEPLPFSV